MFSLSKALGHIERPSLLVSRGTRALKSNEMSNHQRATIRRASIEDVKAIEKCARAAYARYVDRMGREPAPMVADFENHVLNGQIHVLVDGEARILGYVVFYARENHVHLENVAINPEIAGAGLGRKLIAFVEGQARQGGYDAVELYTNEKMTENLKMYPKLGYVETERKTEDGFDRVFYRKAV